MPCFRVKPCMRVCSASYTRPAQPIAIPEEHEEPRSQGSDEKPTLEQDQPVTEKPVAEKPVTEKPVDEAPAVAEKTPPPKDEKDEVAKPAAVKPKDQPEPVNSELIRS